MEGPAYQPHRGDLAKPRPTAWVKETQPVCLGKPCKGVLTTTGQWVPLDRPFRAWAWNQSVNPGRWPGLVRLRAHTTREVEVLSELT